MFICLYYTVGSFQALNLTDKLQLYLSDGQLSVTSLTDRLGIFKRKQSSVLVFLPTQNQPSKSPGGGLIWHAFCLFLRANTSS